MRCNFTLFWWRQLRSSHWRKAKTHLEGCLDLELWWTWSGGTLHRSLTCFVSSWTTAFEILEPKPLTRGGAAPGGLNHPLQSPPSWAAHKHRQLVIFQPNLIRGLSDIKMNTPTTTRPPLPPLRFFRFPSRRTGKHLAPKSERLSESLAVWLYATGADECLSPARKGPPPDPRWASRSWSTRVNALPPGHRHSTRHKGPNAQYLSDALCFGGKVCLDWEVALNLVWICAAKLHRWRLLTEK